MSKLKIGDRISSLWSGNRNMKGTIIDIVTYEPGSNYIIKWDDGGDYGDANEYCEDFLMKINPICLKDLIKE